MKQYLEQLKDVYQNGRDKNDRTGTGTRSKFGMQARYSLKYGALPIVTTKEVHLPSVLHELLWFISGDTNTKYLTDNGVRIWNEWADAHGNLGPVYGFQWRHWPKVSSNPFGRCVDSKGNKLYSDNGEVDQLKTVIETIKTNPDSRRIIVSAWNVAHLDEMALPPCHLLYQFNTEEMSHHERVDWLHQSDEQVWNNYMDDLYGTDDMDPDEVLDILKVPRRWLDCMMYQRSADMFLGVPFNITSYSILTHMIGEVTNTAPRDFVHTIGDAHIYHNHLDQVELQLSREPLSEKGSARIWLNHGISEIDEFTINDIEISNYNCHPKILGKVAV